MSTYTIRSPYVFTTALLDTLVHSASSAAVHMRFTPLGWSVTLVVLRALLTCHGLAGEQRPAESVCPFLAHPIHLLP